LWQANTITDWQNRPADCFSTKYEQKSFAKENIPSWFIFEKT
jgi:hypothetical protein